MTKFTLNVCQSVEHGNGGRRAIWENICEKFAPHKITAAVIKIEINPDAQPLKSQITIPTVLADRIHLEAARKSAIGSIDVCIKPSNLVTQLGAYLAYLINDGKNKIEYNITIAIAMLDSPRTDRYGNGRITHCERNFATSTVTNLLNDVLIETVKQADSIIPKSQIFINPPDEP